MTNTQNKPLDHNPGKGTRVVLLHDQTWIEGFQIEKGMVGTIADNDELLPYVKIEGSEHDFIADINAGEIALAEPKVPTAPMTTAVLEMLPKKGTITALEAGGVLKCRMLPFQIKALRDLGWSIKTQLKKDPVDGQRYARYPLMVGGTA